MSTGLSEELQRSSFYIDAEGSALGEIFTKAYGQLMSARKLDIKDNYSRIWGTITSGHGIKSKAH